MLFALVDELPLIVPALSRRCCHPIGLLEASHCGRPARWYRRELVSHPWPAFCDEHRLPSDVELPSGLPIRRHRVMLTVDVASVTTQTKPGQVEAVEAVVQALEAMGGRVCLLSVQSTVAQNGLSPGQVAPNAG